MTRTFAKAAAVFCLAGALWPSVPAFSAAHKGGHHASMASKPAAAPDLYHQALAMYAYDRSQPLAVAVTKVKQYPECEMIRFTYGSANGERVPAVFFEPFRASNWHPVPALVLLHGLGGSKEDLVKFGHFLAATGYASLIIDEYGHGERQAEGQNGGAASALHGFEQTVIDVRRGIDYLQQRPHISPKRIGIMGFSLGAILAADTMGIDPRVKVAVLISGGGDVGAILKHLADSSEVAKDRLASVDWSLAGIFLKGVDPLTFAGHIAPRPVLMQNGGLDPIVTPDCAKELYNALASGKNANVQIDWCKDSGHFLPLGTIYPHMRIWLDKHLKGELGSADYEISGGI